VNSSALGPDLARHLWQHYEVVHEVTYFAPEARAAADALGFRGFWMGYFAQRSAPLGPVPPAVVRSVFFGFAAERVDRALPDAWSYATPAQALAARLDGVDRALTRMAGAELLAGADVRDAADIAWAAAEAAETNGRPLAAANQILPRPDAPHLALWQAITTLREHRGDGHNAVLVARAVAPVEAHVLKAAAGETDGEILRTGRGRSVQEWSTATEALQERGWLDGSGALTDAGAAARAEIERGTDAASVDPWQAVGAAAAHRFLERLAPLHRAVVAAGVVPYPNPAGLTPAGRSAG
jgi:hypothetical protein